MTLSCQFLHPLIDPDPTLPCQLYLYVYGLELPIRVKETVYENERWNPVNGFTNQVIIVFGRSPILLRKECLV